MSVGADSFNDATDIAIVDDATPYVSDSAPATNYDAINWETGEDTLYQTSGEDQYNTPQLPGIWWKITTAYDGTVVLDASGADQEHDVYIDVFTGGPTIPQLTFVVSGHQYSYSEPSPFSFLATANTTYWIRYSPSNYGLPNDWSSGPWGYTDQGQEPVATIKLQASGPATVYQEAATGATGATGPSGSSGSTGSSGPPIVNGKFIFSVTASESIGVVTDAPAITWLPYFRADPSGPATIGVAVDTPDAIITPYLVLAVDNLAVIGVQTFGGGNFAQVTATSFSPTNGAILPVLNPLFSVTVNADRDFNISIQVDEDASFSTPMEVTKEIDDPAGDFTTYVQFPTALTDGTTYYWRYRLITPDASVDAGWNGPYTLTINTAQGATIYSGSWTVSDPSPSPYIWFATPPRGQPGDLVTLFGQGLAVPSIKITVDDVTATITQALSLPVSTDEDAQIDAVGGEATVEHDEVTLIVPNVDAPGGNIVAEV